MERHQHVEVHPNVVQATQAKAHVFLTRYMIRCHSLCPTASQEAAFSQAQSEAEAREAQCAALAAEVESLVAETDGLR